MEGWRRRMDGWKLILILTQLTFNFVNSYFKNIKKNYQKKKVEGGRHYFHKYNFKLFHFA